MTKKELAKYKEALLAKLNELAKAGHGTDDLAVENTADSLDVTRLVMDRDVLVHNLNHESSVISAVKAALQRVETNDFGICITCEEPIGKKRLEALPWAPRCVTCQGLAEKEKAGYTLPAQQAFA